MEHHKSYSADSQQAPPSCDRGGESLFYYKLGNDHRRRGDYQAAMNAYMEAIALDPDSPAVEALRMLQDIMDYYCKDVYNP